MARAVTKEQLINSSEENFQKLFSLIGSMTRKEQESLFSFEDRDRNIRDVLIHLYEWHQLLLKWVVSNRSGEFSSFLPSPYNWKTYPEMNIEFWKKHQKTTLDKSMELLMESHSSVMKLIDTFSDEELFTKKYFSWTGSTSLGSYCVSSGSSHYDWAIKKIKKHKKNMEETGG
ncbi:ClbS/DfsB family four-helix bundle protein [Chryseobacterium oryctis]|uniref:ClbS/DfsB family four-helix bundle protein n=1 Tax=Chryseobacterium oryctis TaxID=2952618 RepID=A0ABT3HNN4_9FLAO|nr:ClbS/DfsB family four-helix bundle protein [Chryseobacterium oryctis]MCW3161359.1 ClbS/DfsB family four-helix bundle protein [Chryseobacterium oryctis]